MSNTQNLTFMSANLAISHEIGKPEPISPQKEKSYPPVRSIHALKQENAKLKALYEQKLNMVLFYQEKCIELQEHIRQLNKSKNTPTMVISKGGIK